MRASVFFSWLESDLSTTMLLRPSSVPARPLRLNALQQGHCLLIKSLRITHPQPFVGRSEAALGAILAQSIPFDVAFSLSAWSFCWFSDIPSAHFAFKALKTMGGDVDRASWRPIATFLFGAVESCHMAAGFLR